MIEKKEANLSTEKKLIDLCPEYNESVLERFRVIDVDESKNNYSYIYRKCSDGTDIKQLWVKNSQSGMMQPIPFKNITAAFQHPKIVDDNILTDDIRYKKLVSEGLIVEIPSDLIYRRYYNMNDETYVQFHCGYSLRTQKYIRDQMDVIGMLSWLDYAEGQKLWATLGFTLEQGLTDVERLSGFPNCTDIIIGQSKTVWIAQYVRSVGIDDSVLERFTFNHRPDFPSIKKAKIIQDIEKYFNSQSGFRQKTRTPEIFTCKKCQKAIHWLDIPGSIEEKFKGLQINYCGDCKDKDI